MPQSTAFKVTMTAQYPDHPAASLMPDMTEEEFQALKADIKQHGLREPVLIFNGQSWTVGTGYEPAVNLVSSRW